MTKTICFTNNKGGSGKSTVCANLAYELAAMGKRVLLVDGDMQLNLSLSYFDEDRVLELAGSEKTLYNAVKTKGDVTDIIIHTPYENIDIIPSTTLLSQVEYDLFTMMQRELVLKKCLANIKKSDAYDLILIDAPPTLGTWTVNILCASDYCIVPVEASPWGLFGLANLFEFIEGMGEMTDIEVLGVLITKVDERKNYYRQTLEILGEFDSIRVFESCIHVDSSIEWAQDESKPVSVYKKSCRSAGEFRELAKAVAARVSG